MRGLPFAHCKKIGLKRLHLNSFCGNHAENLRFIVLRQADGQPHTDFTYCIETFCTPSRLKLHICILRRIEPLNLFTTFIVRAESQSGTQKQFLHSHVVNILPPISEVSNSKVSLTNCEQ